MNAVTTVTRDPSLPDLVKFLRSFLSPKQIADIVALLNNGSKAATLPPHAPAAVLDPESVNPQPALDKPAAPQGIEDLLQEMEAAYSIEKFAPLTADESRRVRDAFPGFIERCSANQGRHLAKMLKEKLK